MNARTTTSRMLLLSGIVTLATMLVIPMANIGEAASIVWALSIAPVTIGVARVSRHATALATVGMIVGLLATAAIAVALGSVVLGASTSTSIAPFSAAANALLGVWMVLASRSLVSAGVLSARIGWIGTVAGLCQVGAYALLLLGGFPQNVDPSDIASLPTTVIVAGVLSLLGLPLYATWAIWGGRRLALS